MVFHGVDTRKQFKRRRELVPEAYRSFLDFDSKAFAAGALPQKTKELVALGIAHITQCPWCIEAHVGRAAKAGATEQEIGEVIFVAMAMAAGAAWSHGGLALPCPEEHKAGRGPPRRLGPRRARDPPTPRAPGPAPWTPPARTPPGP